MKQDKAYNSLKPKKRILQVSTVTKDVLQSLCYGSHNYHHPSSKPDTKQVQLQYFSFYVPQKTSNGGSSASTQGMGNIKMSQ